MMIDSIRSFLDKEALLPYLLKHLLQGVIGALVLGGLMLYMDVFGLWTLISNFEDPLLPTFLLFFGLFVTWGSAAMGFAIWSLASYETEPAPENRNED